jgi:hypothetical protein
MTIRNRSYATSTTKSPRGGGSTELDIQQRLKRRTFVVSSKQLLAQPTWVKVGDVFSKSDWTLLKCLKTPLNVTARELRRTVVETENSAEWLPATNETAGRLLK